MEKHKSPWGESAIKWTNKVPLLFTCEKNRKQQILSQNYYTLNVST